MSTRPSRRLGAAFVLGCLLASPVVINTQTSIATANLPLQIGGKSFAVGMARAEALALVSQCCRSLGDPESAVFLMQKTGDVRLIGKMFFENGKVSRLVADVRQTGNKDTSDFVLALYRAVVAGQKSARGQVTITAFTDEDTNGTNILLTFPDGRRLRITQFAEESGQIGAQIEEER